MKLLRIVGQLFLICCWCLIITIGVILIQSRFADESDEKSIIRSKETEGRQMIISIEQLKKKYQDEIDEYIDNLKIEVLDGSSLQVSFVLKEEKDPSQKIPMLKKISTLVDSAKGREISFQIRLSIENEETLGVWIHDCKIDSFSIPDFLIDPLNQMIDSHLAEIFQQSDQIRLEAFYLVDDQIVLVGEWPKEAQKVWAKE